MAIRKEANGTYTVDEYFRDQLTKKNIRVKKRGFKTKKEASEFILKKHSNYNNSNTTFIELTDLYLSTRDIRDTSKNRSKALIVNHFIYKDAKIKDITKYDLIYFRQLLNDNQSLSTGTKNQILISVKRIFRFAVVMYGIDDNSIVLNNFKKKYEESKEMEVWSNKEFEQFIKHVNKYVYKAYFTLLFKTGMRKGEALALYPSNVDPINNTIKIEKNLNQRSEITYPKTKSSIRTIKIDEKTMEIIKPLIIEDNTYLFGGDKPLCRTCIDYYFLNAIKESGVKRIRIHDLRHSHATILINNGANIVAVSKRLGHSNINITLSTYTHLLKEKENDILNYL